MDCERVKTSNKQSGAGAPAMMRVSNKEGAVQDVRFNFTTLRWCMTLRMQTGSC